MRPHIYALVGEPDENPEMVVVAERLARDIVKKRLHYLKTKMASAVDMTVTESQVDEFSEEEPVTESQVDEFFEEDPVTESQVDDDEAESAQADQVYQCQFCGVEIKSLEECYPPENRDEHNLLFECYKCYQKAAEFKCLARTAIQQRQDVKKRLQKKKQELLDAATPEQGKPKAKAPAKPKAKAKAPAKPKGPAKPKVKAKGPAKPKGKAKPKVKAKGPAKPKGKKAKGPAKAKGSDVQVTRRSYDFDEHGNRTKTKPAGPVCKFSVDQNVLAVWPDDGNRYPAQVFSASKKVYDVYFPQDSQILLGVKEKDLSLPKKKSLWQNLTRKSFLTMGSFNHNTMAKGTPKNYGKFLPLKMGEKDKVNKYLCREIVSNTRGNGGKSRHYWFDMGYVQKILLKEAYPLHDLKQIFE